MESSLNVHTCEYGSISRRSMLRIYFESWYRFSGRLINYCIWFMLFNCVLLRGYCIGLGRLANPVWECTTWSPYRLSFLSFNFSEHQFYCYIINIFPAFIQKRQIKFQLQYMRASILLTTITLAPLHLAVFPTQRGLLRDPCGPARAFIENIRRLSLHVISWRIILGYGCFFFQQLTGAFWYSFSKPTKQGGA